MLKPFSINQMLVMPLGLSLGLSMLPQAWAQEPGQDADRGASSAVRVLEPESSGAIASYPPFFKPVARKACTQIVLSVPGWSFDWSQDFKPKKIAADWNGSTIDLPSGDLGAMEENVTEYSVGSKPKQQALAIVVDHTSQFHEAQAGKLDESAPGAVHLARFDAIYFYFDPSGKKPKQKRLDCIPLGSLPPGDLPYGACYRLSGSAHDPGNGDKPYCISYDPPRKS